MILKKKFGYRKVFMLLGLITFKFLLPVIKKILGCFVGGCGASARGDRKEFRTRLVEGCWFSGFVPIFAHASCNRQSKGVGLITRKAANAVTPTVELRQDGDNYILVTSSTFKTTEMKFKPGEEFDEERADGAKVKSVCTFDGNTLKQVQKATDGLEVVFTREFGPEEMKAVMTAKDVTCTRIYKVQ